MNFRTIVIKLYYFDPEHLELQQRNYKEEEDQEDNNDDYKPPEVQEQLAKRSRERLKGSKNKPKEYP